MMTGTPLQFMYSRHQSPSLHRRKGTQPSVEEIPYRLRVDEPPGFGGDPDGKANKVGGC